MRIHSSISILVAGLFLITACETTAKDGPASGADDGRAMDTVTVTGTRAEESMPPPPPPPPPPPLAELSAPEPMALADMSPMERAVSEPLREKDEETPVQSGLLTAGDYDDVLNPDLYKSYLDQALQGRLGKKDLPYIDANNRIEIEVVDRLGKAVPLTDLLVLRANGRRAFPLRTGVDGKAYLFPAYDDLKPGMVVRASVKGSRRVEQTLTAEMIDEGGTLTFDLSLDRDMPQQLDLLLTLDATGSMSDEMRYLQAELVAILDRVRSAQPDMDIRAGFIVYRDRGDQYVVRDFAFTDDLEAFKTALGKQSADGGGDMPEAMHDALSQGLDFDWRKDAVKINLLVADAPPHDEHIQATWDSGLISRSRGIHVVSLAASGIDDTAEFMMRGLSQLTNARYLFLTDDSGIGLPHAEPTVDCYVVTRLDQLVERVLVSLITGQRVEPEGEDVIRTVGNYRSGVCAIEQDDVS